MSRLLLNAETAAVTWWESLASAGATLKPAAWLVTGVTDASRNATTKSKRGGEGGKGKGGGTSGRGANGGIKKRRGTGEA